MERTEAWALLTKYNKDHFHLQHALTVEAVMRWYANELGYGDEANFWATVGLLHDLDFEPVSYTHLVMIYQGQQTPARAAPAFRSPGLVPAKNPALSFPF